MSKAILRTKQLSKQFGKQKALDRVTLAIPENSVYGLLGANGAGKSTLLKTMTGILTPTAGSLYFDGHVWSRKDLGKIGSLIETPPIYENLTARENLKVRALMLGVPESRIEKVLQTVDLTQTGKKKAGAFSLGMKQRLGIATALLGNPKLLILDEPASGLDPRTRVEYTAILKELRDQGKTLLVSSHILSELSELCTSIGIIEQGRTVLQGSMDQIFARINSSNPLLISIFSQKEKALAILKSHPCVQTIAVQGDEIKLGFLGDRQDEALLLQQLIDADVMVSSFMREKGSLESLFMQITGHEEERAVLKHEMESGI